MFGRRPTGAVPVRRPAGRVLTASGRQLDLTARETKAPKAAAWQKDAWTYRNKIGEVRYAIGFLKYAASRARLFPALAQPDGAPPVPLAEVEDEPVPTAVLAAAQEAIAALSGGSYTYGRLLAPYAECLEVAGEAVLVGYIDDDAEETWEIRSVDALERKDGQWTLLDAPLSRDGRRLDPETSFVSRLWQPDSQWPGLADSPMRTLLEPCEELLLVSRTIRAATRSRFASAGVLALPNNIDFSGGGPSAGGQDPTDPEADPFFEALTAAMIAAIADEGDASAVVPIVVRADADALDKIKHLTFDRPIDKELLNRAEAALRRIGMGLDTPPEIVTGMADVNHWSAWAIDDSTIRHHIEPLVIRMNDGLTAGYLRHALDDLGVPPEWARRIVLWHDLSTVTTRPNRTQDAIQGYDRLVLSGRTLVEALGFDPDSDMPDPAELEQRRAAGPPVLPAAGSGPTTPGPAAGEPAAQVAAAGPSIELHAYTVESRRLAGIDTQLRERLSAAADAALTRAVERAQNRVRGQAQRDPEMRSVVAGAARPAAVLGLETVTAGLGLDPEELLAGAWAGLSSLWGSLVGSALGLVAALVSRITGEPMPGYVADALAEQQGAGWTWLENALNSAALAALFDPEAIDGVTDGQQGEDPGQAGRIHSLTRGALALAGGVPPEAGGLSSDGTPATFGVRLGGPATGGTVTQHLRLAGVDTLGYEWVYGISERHFAPHRSLDGVVFADFDSPVLANPGGWPHPTLAPGDHRGCHCDAQPVYADGASSATLDAVGEATYDSSYLDVLRQIAATDTAIGLSGTSAQITVAEADRIARHRPSREN